MGLGRLGGLLLRKSWAADRVSWDVFSRGVVGCLVFGVEDTPTAACWVVVGAPACVGVACCRGSGAVRPGCLARVLLLVCGWWGWVWVGWL